MLLIKSSDGQFEGLAEAVRAVHSYACPEIVGVAPEEIAPAYRAWWDAQLGP